MGVVFLLTILVAIAALTVAVVALVQVAGLKKRLGQPQPFPPQPPYGQPGPAGDWGPPQGGPYPPR